MVARYILSGLIPVLGLLSCFPNSASAQAPPKRVLTHADYDIWNSASNEVLSQNGEWFAYILTPPEGDGAIIIRSLVNATIYKIPRGGRPTPPATPAPGTPAPEPTTEPTAPAPAGLAGLLASGGGLTGSPAFTPDGKYVVFPLTPTRAEVDKARADRTAVPGTLLVTLELATGKQVERLPKQRSFRIVDQAKVLILQRESTPVSPTPLAAIIGGAAFAESTATPPAAVPPTGGGTTPGEAGGGGRGRFGTGRTPPGATGAPGGTTPTPPTTSRFGSDFVVRNLTTGKERTFANVRDYTISTDGKTLVYVVSSKTEDKNGVYTVPLGSDAVPVALKAGKGSYTRLSWDERASKLAFFYEEPGTTTPAATTPPATPKPRPLHVYLWDRKAGGAATEIIGPTTKGMPVDQSLSDRASIRFDSEGTKLSFSTQLLPKEKTDTPTPPTPTPTPGGRGTPTTATGDRIDLDLWHYKDELIQPMQKIRTGPTRGRSLSAVYFLDTKTIRPLSDDDRAVPMPDYGDWSTASDSKPYRYLTGYGASLSDISYVNVRTGETKPLLTAHEGNLIPSVRGAYRIMFDGKNWSSLATPATKAINLTGTMKEKFADEDFDSPSQSPSYGLVGFTTDDKFVLLKDRFDIWKIALDGSTRENLTKIGRTSKIDFDLVRFPDPDGEPERGIDLTQPLLLKATNRQTRDSGFYRLVPKQPPQLLLMAPREFGRLVKAKNSDTIVFTQGTYFDYPDYHASDLNFSNIRRITDNNPRKSEFNWGKSELVHYKSLDGVELSGMLIKPENFDSSKKYPMIVYIYERLSDGVHRFRMPTVGTSINPTFYASNGYLVYMPDIAYTIGAPGQSALKCVLPAIQAVVDQGCVDEAAIGIQGHSWGGYQIAYLVTQTNRFKAASSGAPVSDMVSAYGGIRWGTGLPRQFQYERTQSRIGATLWEAPLKYLENSPIFMADRVKTPLMILHNDQDDAVPWYQGIEYYLALRRLGKECYLFNYNGEFHGLRKKATQRDYTLRMQQFFDHHLKGAPMPEWMAKGIPFAERDAEKEQWKKLFTPEKKPTPTTPTTGGGGE